VLGGGAVPAEEGPYLELDTGAHMALIRSLVFTPDGHDRGQLRGAEIGHRNE